MMRKRSITQFIILGCALFLVSCISDGRMFKPVTNSPAPIVSPAPSLTLSAAQISPAGTIEQTCFTTIHKTPEEVRGQGILILRFGWVIDLENGQRVRKPQEAIFPGGLAVSPDRKKMAYRDEAKNQLVIASADRKPIQTVDWDPTWRPYNFSWHTNDTLLIYLNFDPQIDGVLDRGRAIILDLRTGQSQLIPMDYPPKELGDTNWYPAYSPDLTQVVYATNQGKYILGETKTHKTVAVLSTLTYEKPAWSPDGSSVLVAPDDLYLLSPQWEITRLTYLKQSKDEPSKKLSRFYSWSPDGRRIAVWIQKIPPLDPEVYSLAVFDLATGQLRDTCLPWETGPEPEAPLWSPDGKQLIAQAHYRTTDKGWDIVIVNWADQTYEKIADTLDYLGWMLPSP